MSHPAFSVSPLLLLPFAGMLLSIALFPVIGGRFWEKNKNKLLVSVLLSLPVLAAFLAEGQGVRIYDSLVFDYVPFIILLGALFTITGHIHLAGDIEARPRTNALFLAAGAVLASIMGTTGAAMLLIRPLLQTNQERRFKSHTVLFFIGIAANCGGLLTPLGDPPLFMMYLRGAPFTWFLRMFPEWLLVNGLLVLIYLAVDTRLHRREPARSLKRDAAEIKPIRLHGGLNFVWLAGVVAAVALLNGHTLPALESAPYARFVREGVIVLMAVLAWLTTKPHVRYFNRFSWSPIEEVAWLFLGIFVTMVPCLIYLETHAAALGVSGPVPFYYATGALSSFLDNTPTAVTFHSLALGLGPAAGPLVAGIPAALLKAICAGAVFFGSMTYIGNGPNFMVRCVAESHGVRMPHFFAYMLKFSLPVLLPLFVLSQILFL